MMDWRMLAGMLQMESLQRRYGAGGPYSSATGNGGGQLPINTMSRQPAALFPGLYPPGLQSSTLVPPPHVLSTTATATAAEAAAVAAADRASGSATGVLGAFQPMANPSTTPGGRSMTSKGGTITPMGGALTSAGGGRGGVMTSRGCSEFMTPTQLLSSLREAEEKANPQLRQSCLPPLLKKSGRWCAAHVRVAWEIHLNQRSPHSGPPSPSIPTADIMTSLVGGDNSGSKVNHKSAVESRRASQSSQKSDVTPTRRTKSDGIFDAATQAMMTSNGNSSLFDGNRHSVSSLHPLAPAANPFLGPFGVDNGFAAQIENMYKFGFSQSPFFRPSPFAGLANCGGNVFDYFGRGTGGALNPSVAAGGGILPFHPFLPPGLMSASSELSRLGRSVPVGYPEHSPTPPPVSSSSYRLWTPPDQRLDIGLERGGRAVEDREPATGYNKTPDYMTSSNRYGEPSSKIRDVASHHRSHTRTNESNRPMSRASQSEGGGGSSCSSPARSRCTPRQYRPPASRERSRSPSQRPHPDSTVKSEGSADSDIKGDRMSASSGALDIIGTDLRRESDQLDDRIPSGRHTDDRTTSRDSRGSGSRDERPRSRGGGSRSRDRGSRSRDRGNESSNSPRIKQGDTGRFYATKASTEGSVYNQLADSQRAVDPIPVLYPPLYSPFNAMDGVVPGTADSDRAWSSANLQSFWNSPSFLNMLRAAAAASQDNNNHENRTAISKNGDVNRTSGVDHPKTSNLTDNGLCLATGRGRGAGGGGEGSAGCGVGLRVEFGESDAESKTDDSGACHKISTMNVTSSGDITDVPILARSTNDSGGRDMKMSPTPKLPLNKKKPRERKQPTKTGNAVLKGVVKDIAASNYSSKNSLSQDGSLQHSQAEVQKVNGDAENQSRQAETIRVGADESYPSSTASDALLPPQLEEPLRANLSVDKGSVASATLAGQTTKEYNPSLLEKSLNSDDPLTIVLNKESETTTLSGRESGIISVKKSLVISSSKESNVSDETDAMRLSAKETGVLLLKRQDFFDVTVTGSSRNATPDSSSVDDKLMSSVENSSRNVVITVLSQEI